MGATSSDPRSEIRDHGGSLGRAEARFPHAPRPWLDLSTGINARSYPLPPIPHSAFERLPEAADLAALAETAARAYGAASGADIACAPGTQILLPLVAGLAPAGRAGVLSPTYAEHRRAAALIGHQVDEVSTLEELSNCDLAIVVNPNNPDGRVHRRADLLALADHLKSRAGILVVDEAFMDVGPQDERLDGDVSGRNIVVLRSFGKFFGLAGVRIGFAICDSALAATLRDRLGPWAVSGPALTIGRAALADLGWQAAMRADLHAHAKRLDAILAKAGFAIDGGTNLYRYVRHPTAQDVVEALGQRGILVRSFAFDRSAVRFGIPCSDPEFERLATALEGWRKR